MNRLKLAIARAAIPIAASILTAGAAGASVTRPSPTPPCITPARAPPPGSSRHALPPVAPGTRAGFGCTSTPPRISMSS